MARSARLVATGYFRANSRLAIAMQQKYWDQGRSTPLLTTTELGGLTAVLRFLSLGLAVGQFFEGSQ
jgi:hypothetical protein